MARGSIQRRLTKSGEVRWRVRFDVPDDQGGRYQYSQTFATEDEAEAYLAQALTKIHAGTFVAPSNLTLADYLPQWLASHHAMGAISDNTAYSYDGIITRYIMPKLGSVRLDKLSPLAVQRLYTGMKGHYSANTIKLTHIVLRKALQQAVRWRLLPENPLDGVTPPRITVERPELWTAEQLGTFLVKTADDPFAVAWWLLIDTGMRVGELCALRWADCDLAAGTIQIRGHITRDRDGHEIRVSGAKTAAGVRTLMLSPSALDAVKRHRKTQVKRQIAAADWQGGDWLLDRGDGGACAPLRIRRELHSACANANVPPLSPHKLRHLNATLLLAANVHPRIVQERLGHASPAITLGRYSHPSTEMQAAAATLLDAVFQTARAPVRARDEAETAN